MQRAYSFLIAGGLSEMPNPQRLRVGLFKVEGANQPWEKQPCRTLAEGARKFIRYADIKSGKTIQARWEDEDIPPVTFKTTGKHRG
jgi:hypothetical protein